VIKGDNAIVVRSVGNSRSFTIDLSTTVGRIPGICIFEAGNQASVDLKIGISIGRIVYLGRGNTSTGSITFSGNSSLNSGIVDLKGNLPSLAVAGAASAGCSKISATGNLDHYTCD
jgi:hypothetical protein